MSREPTTLFIQNHIPLAPMTTFGIGGTARFFVAAHSAEGLVQAISFAQSKRLRFLLFAGGSNVVFSDGIIDCLVIRYTGGYIRVHPPYISAAAGVSLDMIISRAITSGLSGIELLSGIPGTLGGALVGNAGAYGHSISESVLSVDVWKRGVQETLSAQRCEFSYRHSVFKTEPTILLGATLQLETADTRSLARISHDIIATRNGKYIRGVKSPGSFFKNVLVRDVRTECLSHIPPDVIIDGKIPAGYLLDCVGARGVRVGHITVSDFHSNVFINRGNGTCRDVKRLLEMLGEKVKEKFGILLEPEVRFL